MLLMGAYSERRFASADLLVSGPGFWGLRVVGGSHDGELVTFTNANADHVFYVRDRDLIGFAADEVNGFLDGSDTAVEPFELLHPGAL